MRWLVLLMLAGCPTPIAAVPAMATSTKGLVICWSENPAADDEDKAFLAALGPTSRHRKPRT